jgi:hypothetical protein
VRFSAEANERIEERVFKPLKARFLADPDDMSLFAASRRGQTHVKIVAAIYALSNLRFTVSVDDVQQAVELFEHTMTFTRDQVPRIGRGEQLRHLDRAKSVVAASGGVGVAKHDFYKLCKGIMKGELDQVIEQLEDSGDIVRHAVRTGTGRGRPENRFFTPGNLPTSKPLPD